MKSMRPVKRTNLLGVFWEIGQY